MARRPDLLESLNPAQREAVLHVAGPLLILAGPGSGKTRVVTHRIANLLDHGISPANILALTFTNKAADEMRSRLARLAPGQPVWMGTFHRFGARLLRRHAAQVGLEENYTIYDTDDSLRALKHTIRDLGLELIHFTPEAVARSISWAKNNLITADRYEPSPGHPLGEIVARVYPAYQRRLLESRACDFDDLLLHVAMLLRENEELRAQLDERFAYILVDEYQDTNLAQYAIVRALSVDHPHLAVTGDPDQSIYGWRGANLNNILDFERDYPSVRVVRLEQNYRSTPEILRVAQHLISHNVRRKEKTLHTENPPGAAVRMVAYDTQREEAETIAARVAWEIRQGQRRARDFAVFYRINALSRTLEFALRDAQVPYQIVNGVEFFQRKEIKDILAYLHLLNNPRDDVALSRIINTPPRSIGAKTISLVTDHARGRGLPLLEACRQSGLISGLTKRAAVAVAKFVAMIDSLGTVAHGPVEETIAAVLDESGYRQWLADSDSVEDQDRLANIEELLTAAREFDELHPGPGQLEEFLEQSMLVNDTDAFEEEHDRVTLMTLHSAKGLEFPVVYIVAVEQGLLPHERSKETLDQLEEERRLLFVGITRAREELEITRAKYRTFRGTSRMTIPSSFLMELPRGEMDVRGDMAAASFYQPAARNDDAFDEVPWEMDDLAREEAAEQGSAAPADAYEEDVDDADPEEDTGGDSSTTPALTTAAQLLAGQATSAPTSTKKPAVSPDVFRIGMIVTHPEYGLGRIAELTGIGDKRTARVQFVSGAGEKKFRLAHSPLRPVG